MPQFKKNVLSQYLRTKCDKQLKLLLYNSKELKGLGWPVPLTARPAIQILRDSGVEWEQAKLADLAEALKENVRCAKKGDKFISSELYEYLNEDLADPTFILQPSFAHDDLKNAFLEAIGLSKELIEVEPNFGTFIPDILIVSTAEPQEQEVHPNGEVRPRDQGDSRKSIRVCDIKHAGEANSSYSSEVVLYTVLLSNWIQMVDLGGEFFVSPHASLWTRAKEVSTLTQLLKKNPKAKLSERVKSLEADFEPVDFPIFYQTIEQFFKVDLPRVLLTKGWSGLDWHVDSRCSSCDYLGYRNWLMADDRVLLDANRPHYCIPAAEDTDHLCRIATITRGGRKTLHQFGHTDIPKVRLLVPTSDVFDQHNGLKADRSHLPFRAAALADGAATVAPNTTSIDFPKWTDLEIFITTNFDSGTGLLTAIGSEARFKQKVPFGQASTVSKTWPAEASTLLIASLQEEKNVVVTFLSRLAEVFNFVHNTNSDKGGPEAANTRIQVYFWDQRQFEELCKAIGRHLDEIILPPFDPALRGLIWLFPPDKTLGDEEKVLSNTITFVKRVIQRDLRLPVPHSLTLFNVAQVYHNPDYAPRIPGSLYRDPLSDMIPRERIYEIWSGEPLIKLGPSTKTRSQCIAQYSEVVQRQVEGLRNIVWKFRSDFLGKLKYSARPLEIKNPFNFQSMSEDGRLWYGWAMLEEACAEMEVRRKWSAEPEQLEASYEILRFSDLIAESGSSYTFKVNPSTRDCKIRDKESFLALQDESIPGFLGLRLRDLVPFSLQGTLTNWEKNTRLSKFFEGALVSFDRQELVAEVQLGDFNNASIIRQFLLDNNLVKIGDGSSLVSAPGPRLSSRIRECLNEIKRPSIARGAAESYKALGHRPNTNPPGNDPVTFASRILWDGQSLNQEFSIIPDEIAKAAIDSIDGVDWPFNESQKIAVAYCLKHRLAIVWGPPGTGKTTTAASLVVARVLSAISQKTHLRILVTGFTYNAWESLFNDIIELLEIIGVTRIKCFRVYSQGHSSRAQLPATKNKVTDVEMGSDTNLQDLAASLQNNRGITIVGSVAQQCYNIAKKTSSSPLASYFDFGVLDESSQLDVGKALYPLCLFNLTAQFSLFGDSLQLPPVVSGQPPHDAEWLVGSIQKYLLSRFKIEQVPLLENFRSAKPFTEFAKKIGYPPDLKSNSPDLQLKKLRISNEEPKSWNKSIAWFKELNDFLDPEKHLVALTYPDGKSGQANQFEAYLICAIVQQYFLEYSAHLANEVGLDGRVINPAHRNCIIDEFWTRVIGVVTPHRAQRALVVRLLIELFPDHSVDLIGAAIDTVERFQGGQRDTIIISFGVGDPDLIANEEAFLLQKERTNVAISRARAKCILIISEDLAYHLPSDKETIATSKTIKSFLSETCRKTKQVGVKFGGAGVDLTMRWH